MSRPAFVAVDLFAGGGGASEGIRQATGIAPVLAINHCQAAIDMHAANHPDAIHMREDMFKVLPFKPVKRRGIDLVWASPDCTHHSRAKGGKPRESGRRLLAWVIVEWARDVAPSCIILENVPEFLDWGPLDEQGQPIASRKGETFREFVAALRLAGYKVEWRLLSACDYGAPTTRKRLFLVARCDGLPIAWPEPTHGPERALAYRTAASCIDWSIPCRSIFGRSRELAEATQRRIAAGVKRFVIDNPAPFLVRYQGERRENERARLHDLREPLPTITTEPRFALVAPHLVTTANGERATQAPRVRDIERPLGTVCATGSQGALVAAFLAKHQGGPKTWRKATGQRLDAPTHTVTATDTKSLVSVGLAREEMGNARQVAAFLTKWYGTGSVGHRADEPLHTIRTGECFGLVTVDIDGEQHILTDIGLRMLDPRELARAQGFDDSYILTGSRRDQIARIGNSVCPPVARALVAAQFPHLAREAA